MIDYVRILLSGWTADGEQAAYDLSQTLLKQIEGEYESLRRQVSAINALVSYLEDSDQVVATSPATDPSLDTVEASERPRLILEAALFVWNRLPPGNTLVKVQDVLEELRRRGLDLGVQQPLAVIGTVLASAEGFTKIARNTFEYRPMPMQVVDDTGTPIEAY